MIIHCISIIIHESLKKKAFTKTLLSVLYLQHFSEFIVEAVYPFNLVTASSQNTSPN